MIKLTDRQLEDLLRRCTGWPWTISMDARGRWQMLASGNAASSKVCFEIPPDVSNFDMRLWSLAPVLAAEVLDLRKKLAGK